MKIIGLILLAFLFVGAQANELEEKCLDLVDERMDFLEDKHDIDFDRDLVQRVVVGEPTHAPEYVQSFSGALYDPIRQIIFIDEDVVYFEDNISPQYRQFIQIIEHELGHVYTQQIALEYGYEVDWYNQLYKSQFKFERKLQLKALIEGLAEVLNPSNTVIGCVQIAIWPDENTDFESPFHDGMFYIRIQFSIPVWGQYLVTMLVDKYGYDAVVRYAVQHPITELDEPIHLAFDAWRKIADKYLSEN